MRSCVKFSGAVLLGLLLLSATRSAGQDAPSVVAYRLGQGFLHSDSDLPRNPEEEPRSASYRRMLKDKELGLPVAIPSFPESPPAPPEPSPRPAAADTPRTPEEEARIDMYRRLAEDKENSGTIAVPSIPESPPAPPEPSPRPVAADTPRTPEEEARIDMYRRLAEDKERGVEETALPAIGLPPIL